MYNHDFTNICLKTNTKHLQWLRQTHLQWLKIFKDNIYIDIIRLTNNLKVAATFLYNLQ